MNDTKHFYTIYMYIIACTICFTAQPTVESHTEPKVIIFNATERLLAECIVSGDPLPNIEWMVNSKPIAASDFDLQTTEVNGAFKYDQTKARKSVLKWKSAPNLTCPTVAGYAGRYSCVGKDNGFGGDTTSKEINIEVLCEFMEMFCIYIHCTRKAGTQ